MKIKVKDEAGELYQTCSSLYPDGKIPVEWHEIWYEIETWMNKAGEKETPVQLSERICQRYTIANKRTMQPKLPIEELFRIVEAETQYTKSELLGKGRTKYISCVRQITAFLLIDVCKTNKVKAAKILNRDHTTILYSEKLIRNNIEINDELVKMYYYPIMQRIDGYYESVKNKL